MSSTSCACTTTTSIITVAGNPGEVGSSPDRIMMDQEAKTYHLYLPSFLASTVHLTLSKDQPTRGRPSKSSLQIPILSRLRAQELEDFVLFLECYFIDAM
ncbi:hypothetical protein ALC53_07259 [Atta colombica]|uniref:Uncharacterized protein n=1 Tax=Atta colombica TaxID=520822 RepID=A0A195BCI0_9HYME|nr:hypothetical protein ALC53_07259 [Atta colombica]